MYVDTTTSIIAILILFFVGVVVGGLLHSAYCDFKMIRVQREKVKRDDGSRLLHLKFDKKSADALTETCRFLGLNTVEFTNIAMNLTDILMRQIHDGSVVFVRTKNYKDIPVVISTGKTKDSDETIENSQDALQSDSLNTEETKHKFRVIEGGLGLLKK